MNVSLLTFVLAGLALSGGEQRGRPIYDFGTLKTFRCDFTESEGRRTTAAGVTTAAKQETFSDLVLDAVDYQRRTARFVGNAGSETVLLIDGVMIVSFLEVSQTGNVNVLSIFKQTASLDTYRAAYSRHSGLTTGDRTVSQSYGTCRGLI